MPGPLQEDRLYGHARHAAFYDIELAAFDGDLPFYRTHLPANPCRILELGCGTGRVTRLLAADGHWLVGVDLSPAMLTVAKSKPSTGPAPLYACMDITRLGLAGRFDAVIIPYNTLNLLTEPNAINRCLEGVRALLSAGGRLLAQVHVPDQELRDQAPAKRFQFSIMEQPDGSKVIKESIRRFDPHACREEIIDRYRLRFRPGQPDEDWQYAYTILGRQPAWWFDRLSSHGFTVTTICGDYDLSPFDAARHTTLLLATASR